MTDEVLQTIGCFLDHPSVYMGGASKRSLEKAEKLVRALSEAGYQIVPKEPSPTVLRAIRDAEQRFGIHAMEALNIWRAALAAAEKNPNPRATPYPQQAKETQEDGLLAAAEQSPQEAKKPCKWGGGNDYMSCSVCGLGYEYRKDPRPPCPRLAEQSPEAKEENP